MSARAALLPPPEVHFFLVGIPLGQASNRMDRYVRAGASPDEPDPWVRVPGQPGRSRAVRRFQTRGEGEAWAEARRRLKGTRCRVVACRGPEVT